MSMPSDESQEVVPVPDNDQEGTQFVYDTLANEIQSMPQEVLKKPRFPFWAITAVINLLCRLVIVNSNMTKEQLLKQVGDIFTGYKDGKAEKRLLN
jgi:hypothetical protein